MPTPAPAERSGINWVPPACLAERGGKVERCLHCQVRHLTLCRALDDDELRQLAPSIDHISLAPRQLLLLEHDPAEFVHVVLKGMVAVFKTLPDGRRQITGLLLPGDLLGAFWHDRYYFSAEAVGRSEVCRIPAAVLRRLCRHHPELEHQLVQAMSDELFEAQTHMLTLGRKTALERLASFLVTLARRAAHRGKPANPLRLCMTRTDIADSLGLTDETVSRTFSQLVEHGLIRLLNRHEVRLLNSEVLEQIAEGARPPAPSRSRRRPCG
jgi:CRP/FNR family transcriptional regulator